MIVMLGARLYLKYYMKALQMVQILPLTGSLYCWPHFWHFSNLSSLVSSTS